MPTCVECACMFGLLPCLNLHLELHLNSVWDLWTVVDDVSSEGSKQTCAESYKGAHRLYMTHLYKTSPTMHFLLLEYSRPFERMTHPFYNDTKITTLSGS